MTGVDYLRIGLTVLQLVLVALQLWALRAARRESGRQANAIIAAFRAAMPARTQPEDFT